MPVVHTSTYRHRTRKFLGQYIPVHTVTSMYCLVPAQYKVVQDGTWWYMKVHGSTMNGTRRYMKVREGTYWYTDTSIMMYRLVLHGAMWYKEVHGGTGRYIVVQ